MINETQDPLSTTLVSGYSDHQGAGAIDIVVGRGAPFPTKSKNKPLAPIFTTIPDKAGHIKKKLANLESHPKMLMDAARIYISQMTDIDENFKIRKPLTYVHADSADDREYAYLGSI